MNKVYLPISLIACGWWIGCLFAFLFGGYEPSDWDIGSAMVFSTLLFLTISATYWQQVKSKRDEV